LNEQRFGYENFVRGSGQTILGVQGNLRRDERNRVASLDPYFQGEWRFGERWRLLAGARASTITFESNDHYLVNGDDSGSTRYRSFTPTLGVVYRPSSSGSVYASYGRGFETPTLNEIAYRADGSAGLNGDVDPSRSNNLELGLKSALGPRAVATLALFSVSTRDEIVVLANSGGRSAFGNAGATSRRGAEVSIDWRPAARWSLYAAATALRAQFDDGFLTCAAAPCPAPSVPVAAGNRLPAVPAWSGLAEVRWRPGWADWQLQWRAQSKLYVDDRNSQSAPGYGVLNLSVARSLVIGGAEARAFLRVNNVLDKDHIGAVIVNEVNGRYFEPAAKRTWLAGIDLHFQ
jgi:iron complex outermembrane receptor protein